MPFPNKETQWKPGQSGNPGGRPRGKSLLTRIQELLDLTQDLDGQPLPEGKTLRDMLAEAYVRAALGGGSKELRDLMDRTDGKPRVGETAKEESTLRDAAIARMRALHDPHE